MVDPEVPGTSNDEPDLPAADSPTQNDQRSTRKKVDLIDVVNDLQNKLVATGHSLNINLPQIVVVGSQSAGKSSVLEAFVGKEFLPRGKDTVTRRPTIIQMFPSSDEYVLFAHKPREQFRDFEKVKEEIQAETLRHPGRTGFSPDPISLQIYSPRVLKLTVVDLPGLIKNVEEGQSQSSILEVRNMVLNAIKPEETIILAVTPATQEIVTSDALEIAKEVDPRRERTIGVLTKLDALNDGTDVRNVLDNQKIYLKKGYVGVVNRNQREIEEKKDFRYILAKEKEFLANHPAYKDIAHLHGIPYLTRMLQKNLRGHIKRFLLAVRSEISRKLVQHQKELKDFENKMGESIEGSGSNDKRSYIMQLIQTFTRDVEIQFMGNSELVTDKKFSAGAMINYKLSTEVRKNLTLTMIPDETQTALLITNMLGFRIPISIPDLAINSLNRLLLEQYKDPMKESVACIKEIMKLYIAECAKKLERYTQLKNEVLYKIESCINKRAESTIERLIEHIEANMYYINYSHPDFDSSACEPMAPPAGPIKLWDSVDIEEHPAVTTNPAPASNPAAATDPSGATDPSTAYEPSSEFENLSYSLALPSKEKMLEALKSNESNKKNVQYSSTLLLKILEHVQKQMMDVAMKYIIFFLVKKVLEFIKTELLTTTCNASNFPSIMEDCEADFRWKEETKATCRMLKEALDAIYSF